MGSNGERIVLTAFRPFYRMLFIYDRTNFQQANPNAILWNVCKAFIFSALAFSLFVAWLGELVHCARHSFDLSVIALQLALMINLTSITITYVAFAMKKQLIGTVLDRLQATVNQSMIWAYVFQAHSC